MDASNKQETLAEKFAAVWEKKNSKVARAGGVSLMALSLAACGSSSETPAADAGTDTGTDTGTDAGTDAGTDTGTEAPAEPTTPVATALVAGEDTTGTAGADSFSGATAALTADTTLVGTDDIDGGEGADTIALSLGANFGGFTTTGDDTGSMTGIETVELSTANTVARTFDATGVSGVETYKIDGSNGGVVSITDSADLAAIELSSIASGAFSITYAAATADGDSPVAGDEDTLNVTVEGLGSSTADVSITAAGVEALSITSNAAATAAGATNYMNLSGVSDAAEVSISGAADTDVAAVSAATTSFDASGVTGAVTAALAGAATGKLATVKTGTGDDSVSAVLRDLTSSAAVDMGEGDDTLTLSGVGTATAMTLTGVETLDISGLSGTTTLASATSSDVVAGDGTKGALVPFTGTVNFYNDTGAKNIDIIGDATGTIVSTTTGAVDIDIIADGAATKASVDTGGGAVQVKSAASIDVNVGANINQTGTIDADNATSATITTGSATQSALDINLPSAETVTITAGGAVTATNTDLSAAQILDVTTAKHFQMGALDAVTNLTVGGTGSSSEFTATTIGTSTNTNDLAITATGLAADFNSGNIDGGEGSVTITATSSTGDFNAGTVQSDASVTIEKGAMGQLDIDEVTGKSVTVKASSSINAVEIGDHDSDGISFTTGDGDITANTVVYEGSAYAANKLDIASLNTGAMKATLTGGAEADLIAMQSGSKVSSVTVDGDLKGGADKLYVELANFTTNTTSTVSVDLSKLTADTTNQDAIIVDIDAEVTNKVSVTGTSGTNDTVRINGNVTEYATVGLTLSGIEKIAVDNNITLASSTLSGQTIDLIGDGASTDTVTISGTANAETINLSGIGYAGTATDAGTSTPTITLNAGDGGDTITGPDVDSNLNGDAGDDSITGGEGADAIAGGTGVDTITLTETTAEEDVVTLTAGVADYDVIIGFDAGGQASDDNLLGADATHAWYGNGAANKDGILALTSDANLKDAEAADDDATVFTISTDVASGTFDNFVAGAITEAEMESAVITALGLTGAAAADDIWMVFVDDGEDTGVFKFTGGDAATDDAVDASEISIMAILDGVADATSILAADVVFA